ncbi:hypothetical protein [Mesorhizobium sp. LSJC255A00]|uniref:hypothetical protein n=1 Tax=Mesorhizobium sp. LSJC255A00 TaxID=1287313 RepID=UPI00067ED8E3|nr:hypothetical protein [Mesorhizobium sp. LSJC255A00]
MRQAVAADQRDQVDIAQRPRTDQQGRADIDRLLAKPPHQGGRRIFAFGQGGGDIAARFDRHAVEQRQRQILELGDLAARRAGQRAERRHGGAKQPFGFSRFRPYGDLPEIRS